MDAASLRSLVYPPLLRKIRFLPSAHALLPCAGSFRLEISKGRVHTVCTAAFILIVFSLGFSAQATAASYLFTTIDVPGADYYDGGVRANGINDAGQVVGQFRQFTDPTCTGVGCNFSTVGFELSGATYTTLLPASATAASAGGINNADQVVGYFQFPTIDDHGFLWDGSTYTTVDVPGAVDTVASGINDAGQVVGYFDGSDPGSQASQAFVFDGSTFTTLNVPGADPTAFTGAFSINSVGQVVGSFSDGSGTYHGFLKTGEAYTTLDVPGAVYTLAQGINNTGQIVGESYEGSHIVHGFLRSGTTYSQIYVPGASFTNATGINSPGQIVGTFGDASGSHGFVATPISMESQITGRSLVAVTIFGSSGVDVTTLDSTTLRLGPTPASPDYPAVVTDVNGDGVPDLVAWFRYQDTGLSPGASQACFSGNMSGQTFLACDPIVNAGCGLGFELAPILPPLLWLRGRKRRNLA